MEKQNAFSHLSNLGCIDELEARLIQLEGVLGAIEASSELDPRLLKACMWSASTLVVESQQIARNLCDFLPREK